MGSCGACLWVVGTEYHSRDSGIDYCPSAHRAWLEGYDKGCLVEMPVADVSSSGSESHDLGMGSGITAQMALVSAGTDDFAVNQYDRADGNVAGLLGRSSLVEGKFHGLFVCHWRRVWDSNPRRPRRPHTLSKRAHSSALATLRGPSSYEAAR